jgi:hypothetical protein
MDHANTDHAPSSSKSANQANNKPKPNEQTKSTVGNPGDE